MEDYGLISVIIPVYNVEKYLNQCIDSVLAQTYPCLEMILVDDGSTDRSGAICDEYAKKDARISVIHQPNAGLSEARNAGYSQSKGKFISFIDSDDWIEKEFYQKMIELIAQDKSDFVFCDGMSFEDSSKGYSIKQGYKRRKKYDSGSGLVVFRELQEHRDFHCAVQMYVWNRDFLDKNQMRFYPGILYEDMIFTFGAFLQAENVSHCYEPLYQRRYRKGSIVTSKPKQKNFLSAFIVYEQVCFLSDNSFEISIQDYCSRCALRAIELYKNLSAKEKEACKMDYAELKEKVRLNNYHQNKALKMLCYGKPFWLVYKSVIKVLGK